MNIVFLSHTYMRPDLVVGSHHLSRKLALMGHVVTHISVPVTPLHLPYAFTRSDIAERFQIHRRDGIVRTEKLVEYVPFSWVPWAIGRGLLKWDDNAPNLLVKSMTSLSRWLLRQGIESIDIVFIDEPRMFGLRSMLPAKKWIYRVTDNYPQIRNDRTIAIAERRLLLDVDGVVATSAPVLEHIKQYGVNRPGLLLENGVDFNFFSKPMDKPPEYADGNKLRFVYAGAMDHRFDFQAIKTLALSNPEAMIYLIGPVSSDWLQGYSDLNNVRFLGPRRYEDLPAYLQNADIGLMTFNQHDSNQGRSPMKMYEYLASGLKVLASGTDELKRRASNNCFFYHDHQELATTSRSLLKSGVLNTSMLGSEVMEMDWTGRAQKMMSFTLSL